MEKWKIGSCVSRSYTSRERTRISAWYWIRVLLQRWVNLALFFCFFSSVLICCYYLSTRSLRVWTLEGECIQQLDGHTSFVYSVDVLSTGEFVSAGEDRTVRIWKDGQNIQTLQQPCISVWTVAALPNDDIVVGGSDAAVRVFTRNMDRMASAEGQKEFEELLASQAIPS